MQIGHSLGMRPPLAQTLLSRVLVISPAGALMLPGLGSIAAGGSPRLVSVGAVVLPAGVVVTVLKNSTWIIS